MLRQRFQDIEGEAALGQARVSLQNARLRGNKVHFGLLDARGQLLQFTADITANRMVDQVTSARPGRNRFEAVRQDASVIFPEAEATEQEKNEALRVFGNQ